MQSEKQYIDLYGQCRDMLMSHSAEPMNAVRDAAFSDFRRLGFPTKKVERYKYTTSRRCLNLTTGLTSTAWKYR